MLDIVIDLNKTNNFGEDCGGLRLTVTSQIQKQKSKQIVFEIFRRHLGKFQVGMFGNIVELYNTNNFDYHHIFDNTSRLAGKCRKSFSAIFFDLERHLKADFQKTCRAVIKNEF